MHNINGLKKVLFAGIATVILSGGAMAADAGGWGGSPTPPADEAASPWDVAFGVTVTNDYVSRGISQTSGGAAVQPWAELTVGMFYLGYWGSNVDSGFTGGNWEHDLSIGVRPEFGPVSLDIGYVRYIYDTGDCCGEVYVKGEVSPVDPLTLGAHFFYSPDFQTTYTEVNASVGLMEHLSASAAVGFIGNSSADYTTWNAGLTWNPVEPLEIDVRYHWAPSSVANGVQKVVVSASVSSSLRSLGVIR